MSPSFNDSRFCNKCGYAFGLVENLRADLAEQKDLAQHSEIEIYALNDRITYLEDTLEMLREHVKPDVVMQFDDGDMVHPIV